MTQTVSSSVASAQAAVAIPNSEFLSFTLGNEDYGVEILKVQEIRGYEAVTHIANAPDFSSSFDTQYITGPGTVNDRMLILVDIEKLMSDADMALMEQATLQ
ncbi:MAG: chemotaxis protein CheW [Burkholderiales bacterium]|nr:chemotaxis protein CheW [Burkholderiales bacterium]